MSLESLLNGFYERYYQLESRIQSAVFEHADSTVLSRIGDDLDAFIGLVNEHNDIFPEQERSILIENLRKMQLDVRLQFAESLQESHHGAPELLEYVYTGRRGRPAIFINEDFLRTAITLRSVAAIARFLGLGRTVIRDNLLSYGIVEPGRNPFPTPSDNDEEGEGDIQPEGPEAAPNNCQSLGLDRDTIDTMISHFHAQYPNAGCNMLGGIMRSLGFRVSREQIRQSLLRIDPVRRVFERVRIQRCVYSVPGPMSLWHHDGQHGLIRWGIVIHGFIDGYSRFIVGLRAANNNRGETVLGLFLDAANAYQVPQRVRGDYGTENILVAAWMERFRGPGRGSYIWGRSVHNVRIERLWVDVTVQIGSIWKERFRMLELRFGLDINNTYHIWLLHFLFLQTINEQLEGFARGWNEHIIRGPQGPGRSPRDMFVFDPLALGIRGDPLPTEDVPQFSQEVDEMPEDGLDAYGVDWGAAGLDNPNNDTEGLDSNTLTGRTGLPDRLSEVALEAPHTPSSQEIGAALEAHLFDIARSSSEIDVANLWFQGLSFARNLDSAF